MGTQKNRLNEMVLLSTKNICLYLCVTKKNPFDTEEFCLCKHVNYLFLTVEPANAYSFNETDEDQSHWCCMCVQESDDVLPTLEYSSKGKNIFQKRSNWVLVHALIQKVLSDGVRFFKNIFVFFFSFMR